MPEWEPGLSECYNEESRILTRRNRVPSRAIQMDGVYVYCMRRHSLRHDAEEAHASTRVGLLAAICGFGGIGAFHGLVGAYHLALTINLHFSSQ